jgi:hypothetical protein
MRTWDEPKKRKAHIELIPMIDVMMFLLVFFVLVSLNVDNLFDKKYLDGVYTTKTNAASYSGFRDGDPAYIVGLERTVTVSLEANF